MTLLVEKGSFSKETSNVDGTDQTVTLTNGSLTPKVLWLWTTGQTSNATYAENWMTSYGFSDGTNDACIAGASEDNETTSDTAGVIRNDSVVCILDAATTPTTVNALADVVSFNAGTFVLNWATSDAVASIIHYMVMGGTDITNVKVTQHTTLAAAGTGNEAFTGVGFQGDFINILAPHSNATSTATVNTVATNWAVMIGAATSATARWVFGGNSEHNQNNMDTYSYKEITRCLAQYQATTGNDELVADFVSFDADGFTLNYILENVTVDHPFFSLVIKGGLWDAGTGTAPASVGQQTINTTSGRDPEGVMMFTWGDTTTSSGATGEAHNRISIGGADNSLNEGCISTMDTDATANAVATHISLITKTISAHTANATASSSTTLAEADIVDMNNNGNFIIDWTTTLSGMGYVWFAVSVAVAGGVLFERSVNESLTIASTTKIQIRRKPAEALTIAASPKIQIGRKLAESLTVAAAVKFTVGRKLAESLTIATAMKIMIARKLAESLTINAVTKYGVSRDLAESLTVEAAVTGLRRVPRTLNETLELAGTVVRFYHANRSLVENIVIDTLVVRPTKIFRSLTESLTVTDEVAGAKLFRRTVNETVEIVTNVVRFFRATRTLTESLTVEGVVVSIRRIPKSLSESLTIDAAVARLYKANRSTSENLIILANVARMFRAFRSLSETVVINANGVGIRRVFRSLSESLTVNGIVARMRRVPRSVSASLTITADVVAEALQITHVTLNESVAIVATCTRKVCRFLPFLRNI